MWATAISEPRFARNESGRGRLRAGNRGSNADFPRSATRRFRERECVCRREISESAVCNAAAIPVRSASGKGKFADRADSARTGRRFQANSLPNSEHRRSAPVEISGMKTAVFAAACFLAATRCYATGGDSYEYPAKLSDTLAILPGKSLGEIFLETSAIKPPTGIVGFCQVA